MVKGVAMPNKVASATSVIFFIVCSVGIARATSQMAPLKERNAARSIRFLALYGAGRWTASRHYLLRSMTRMSQNAMGGIVSI
jgi:hypothetical protein